MSKITLEAVISASAKGLKAAMDAARSAVRTASEGMKRAIGSIGDAFQKPIDKSRELNKTLSEQDGKQLLSSLTGMAGKIGIIAAGCKAVGQILWKNWLEPMVMAKKNAAELASYVTKMNGASLDKRVQGAMGKYEDMKKLAELVEQNAANPSAEGAYNIRQQQGRIRELYGIDATRGNLEGELKKAYEEGREQAIEALKGQIATLDQEQEKNNAFLKSFVGRSNKMSGEWERLTARNDAIKGERVQLLARIRELEKGTGAADTIGGIKARTEDRTRAMRDQRARAGAAFEAYENSQTDTELQAKVRAAMERYRQAIEDGIEPERAKAAAERDMAKAMQERYSDYLAEVRKRADALKSARQRELYAQNRVLQAQQSLADAIEAKAGYERDYRRGRRRERLERQVEQYTSEAEGAGSRGRRRRAESKAQQARDEIDRMDREDRRRERRERRKALDEAISRARKEARGAGMDYGEAAQARIGAQRRMQSLRSAGSARRMLRGQAGKVIRDYRSDKLEMPLIGGNSSRMINSVEAAKRRLSRDMQELERRYQTPKEVKTSAEVKPAVVTPEVRQPPHRDTDSLRRREVMERRGGLHAPGIGGNPQALATAYTGQLEQLHRDLKEMQQKAYMVR